MVKVKVFILDIAQLLKNSSALQSCMVVTTDWNKPVALRRIKRYDREEFKDSDK